MQNKTKTTTRLATCALLVTFALAIVPDADARVLVGVDACGGDGSCSSYRFSDDDEYYYSDNDINQGSTNQCAQSVNVGFAIAGSSNMCSDDDTADSEAQVGKDNGTTDPAPEGPLEKLFKALNAFGIGRDVTLPGLVDVDVLA